MDELSDSAAQLQVDKKVKKVTRERGPPRVQHPSTDAADCKNTELEERGGLQKLNQESKREIAEKDRASYRVWMQSPSWFDEEVEGGTSDEPLRVSYAQTKQNGARLRGLYDGTSDFERIKVRAENLYLKGDYERCAATWLRLFGAYNVGSRTVGGMGLEIQDSVGRCLIQLGRCSSEDAASISSDMQHSSSTRPLVYQLLNARILRAAGDRPAEALAAFQEAAGAHPVDPMQWVQLADAYRQAGAGTDPRAALLARRSLRLATKMMQYGSNAAQCRLSMRHFERTQEALDVLCRDHESFFLGGAGRGEGTAAYFQGYRPSPEEVLVLAEGATAFEEHWLCGDGAEIATRMLEKVTEDNIREAAG